MKKIAIIYGDINSQLRKKSVEVLTEFLLDATLLYPVCFEKSENVDTDELRCIYIGTKNDNKYIREHSEKVLTKEQEYYIRVKEDTVIIEGFDGAGVLYGVVDFYNKYINPNSHREDIRYYQNVFEADVLPEFEHSEFPQIKQRGFWTWGHVIYDYRKYLDNMVKLKLNSLIVWNDFAPINGREIVEYAHKCGIKLIWGFQWLWDTDCAKFDLNKLDGAPEMIFENYMRDYVRQYKDADGIYFQTFTELETDSIGGKVIAEAASEFVNKTAKLFYDENPDIEIQFGLHATSVAEKTEYIGRVDKRIRIVWENCGAFPFGYVPDNTPNFDETKDFADKIAHLRGKNDKFGAVTKGLVQLDWSEFEHLAGPHFLGVSSQYVKNNRIARKNLVWKCVQSYWMAYADKAQEMIRTLAKAKDGDLYMYGLVEDGMFEEKIMFPAALYAQLLWDCTTDIKITLQETASRNYVDFA